MHQSIVPPGYALERERKSLKTRLLEERAEELAKASFFGRMRIRRQVRRDVEKQLKNKPEAKRWFEPHVIH